MGTKRAFRKHGRCGMDFSDLLPHMASCADDWLMIRSLHTDQFNHHPGQLVLHCGRAQFGLPTIGSWLNCGLGSESRNLPGCVVLNSGRGTSCCASLWQWGFLPWSYAGVLFRNQGELAFRMQASAPELTDLSGESQATLEMYGVNRPEPYIKAARGGDSGQFKGFATNCLLARRLVERGTRFVSILHASWDHHSNLDNELAFNCGMADQPHDAR